MGNGTTVCPNRYNRLAMVNAPLIGSLRILFLYDVCEPYLRFWRRILPFRAGPIDFSPMVAILALFAVSRIAISILSGY